MKHSELNSRTLYFRLLTYVRPYWKVLATSVILLALVAATEPLFPALMKPLLDEGFTNRNEQFIKWVPIGLVALFLLRGVLSFASTYTSTWVAHRVVTDLRNQMFSHLIHLPTSFFDKHSSARLSSHIAYDVNNVTGAATNALTVIVRDSLTVIGLLGWLFWLDWKLTLVTIVFIPPIGLIVRYFNRRLRRVSNESQHAMASITHSIEEASSHNRVVKVFTAEDYETKRFNTKNEKQRGLAIRATVAYAAITPLVQILVSFSVAIIIALAFNDTDKSGDATATAGGFMSFLTALLMLLPPIKRLTNITSIIQRGLAAAEMVFSLIDEPVERSLKHEQPDLPDSLRGEIQFEHVTFNYPECDKPSLENFSLHIPSGQTIALVGKSGSGKTTITSLLSNFYEIEHGKITLDGISFEALSPQHIRKNISLVSQDIRLFNESILLNVAYGESEPDHRQAREALAQADLLEFVETLPDAMDTLVGQNGIKLSGGQRQRIALARAFYKDAPILILDEATSALDTESERAIQKNLETFIQSRTTIMIAHRLSTIEKADRIVVLENGIITESGTHQELINTDGSYSHYYNLQFSIE